MRSNYCAIYKKCTLFSIYSFFFFFFSFLSFFFFFERERERECELGREAKGERKSQAVSMLSTEPDAGLDHDLS